jgi:acyl-CoA reductase-like NAD-dependent aldehyde dehydrogenase
MEPTAEQRSEWGRQGAAKTAEVRKAKKALTGAERALLRLEASTDDLVDLTIKAAKGEEPFEELPPKERAAMLKFALEQVLGRPGARKAENPTEDPEVGEGLRFGTAEVPKEDA